MILRKGNMWDRFGQVSLFFFTSNPVVNSKGRAVMGRGIAKQVADRFPELPLRFGRLLTEYKEFISPKPPKTGLLGSWDGQMIGFFMVKDHWKSPASLKIISESTNHMLQQLPSYVTVALNFPGIGNGRLLREDVLPIIEKLPDNVEIWEYE